MPGTSNKILAFIERIGQDVKDKDLAKLYLYLGSDELKLIDEYPEKDWPFEGLKIVPMFKTKSFYELKEE